MYRPLLAAFLAIPACAPLPDMRGDTAPPPVAAPAPEPAPAAEPVGETIPQALQGRWGLTPADCTSQKGDAKGLLVVGPQALEFYESRATLRELRESAPTRIAGTFDFAGEGQTWTRDQVLDVQDDGLTLIRREYGEGAAPGPLRYGTCG